MYRSPFNGSLFEFKLEVIGPGLRPRGIGFWARDENALQIWIGELIDTGI